MLINIKGDDMNKRLVCGLVLTISFAAQVATAGDLPLTTTVSMEKILSNLQDASCMAIKEVEYDDGVYKAKAVCQGQYITVKLDPKTGALQTPIATAPHISMLDAVKAVESAGYTNAYKIEMKHDHYEVAAINAANSKKVELNVDAATGKVSEDLF